MLLLPFSLPLYIFGMYQASNLDDNLTVEFTSRTHLIDWSFWAATWFKEWRRKKNSRERKRENKNGTECKEMTAAATRTRTTTIKTTLMTTISMKKKKKTRSNKIVHTVLSKNADVFVAHYFTECKCQVFHINQYTQCVQSDLPIYLFKVIHRNRVTV